MVSRSHNPSIPSYGSTTHGCNSLQQRFTISGPDHGSLLANCLRMTHRPHPAVPAICRKRFIQVWKTISIQQDTQPEIQIMRIWKQLIEETYGSEQILANHDGTTIDRIATHETAQPVNVGHRFCSAMQLGNRRMFIDVMKVGM